MSDQEQRVVVLGPVADPEKPEEDTPAEKDDGVVGMVHEPAKVMRIGSMIKQLLEEVRGAPLDEAGRTRLAEIHRRSIAELKQGLAPELGNELDRLITPLSGATPSESELRIAQAQLVGWLEGLFHGIQTAIYAQQMAARAQLEQMQRALPPGAAGGGAPGPEQGGLSAASESSSGGMYL